MANDFAKGVHVVLTGTVNWARLTKEAGPDQMSGKYSVDLTLDSESKKLLEGMKILNHVNVKTQDGNYKYEEPTVRMKTMSLPTIWDRNKNVFTGMIGNGSTMRVKGVIKSWEVAGKKGLTCYINKGVVLELKEYEASEEEMEVLFEGVVPTPEQVNIPGNGNASSGDAADDDDLPF